MPRRIPVRTAGLAIDLYAIRHFEAGEVSDRQEYWFYKIKRNWVNGRARYSNFFYRWHDVNELGALITSLREIDPELYGYNPEEPRDFIKLWESWGPYK